MARVALDSAAARRRATSDFASLSAVLCSSYLDQEGMPRAGASMCGCRQQESCRARPRRLHLLLDRAAVQAGEQAAAALRRLLEALDLCPSAAQAAPRRRRPNGASLCGTGWPAAGGRAQRSAVTSSRFDALRPNCSREFAAWRWTPGHFRSHPAVCDSLARTGRRRTAFEPASLIDAGDGMPRAWKIPSRYRRYLDRIADLCRHRCVPIRDSWRSARQRWPDGPGPRVRCAG